MNGFIWIDADTVEELHRLVMMRLGWEHGWYTRGGIVYTSDGRVWQEMVR